MFCNHSSTEEVANTDNPLTETVVSSPTPEAPLSGSAVVGREAELHALRAEGLRAGSAEPRVVLVEGDAGIGKTALVQAFLTGWTATTVLWASCDESEAALGFGVVQQLADACGNGMPPRPATEADALVLGGCLFELLGA